ncbi:MAG: hypothetical protein HKN09_11940 [Saprospiraceae bacterium]|nr:hypothetical protein [Saprospiraceae bacterium]
MNANRFVIILFLLFPVVISLQLVYGLIVREPYPSFMMPGFSRIDNDGNTYKLIDRKIVLVRQPGDTILYDLDILNTSVSKIAISRMIDLAFFNSGNVKTENSAQKKYYGIIKSAIGPENYKKYILDIRYPPIQEEDLAVFKKWFVNNISKEIIQDHDHLYLRRIEEIRGFKSGETISINTLDEIKLTDG